MTRARRLAAAAAILVAAPALGYVLPVPGILKRVAQHRQELGLHALEVKGTIAFAGDAAREASAAIGMAAAGAELGPVAATIDVRMPGRCRLDVAGADVIPAERPAIVSRSGRIAGTRGLDRVSAAVVLVRGVCALLGERPAGADGDRAYAEALGAMGVDLREAHLGRLGARIAYVVGERLAHPRPQAWFDKESFQPLRVISVRGSAVEDVRLVDYGSPTGGDLFPRSIEVYSGGQLVARFTTEKVSPNPKLPDALF